jgi:hypothetical protein
MGVDVVRSITRRLNARLALSAPVTAVVKETTDGTDYDLRVKLGSIAGLLDVHPFAGSFHLTAGAYVTRHAFSFVSKEAAQYDVGGETYASAELEALEGTAATGRLAPYFGIGWGNAAGRRKRFGVNLDLGVLSQAAPSVTLSARGPIAEDPAFRVQLEREAHDLQERLRGFRRYPIVAVSLSYRLR